MAVRHGCVPTAESALRADRAPCQDCPRFGRSLEPRCRVHHIPEHHLVDVRCNYVAGVDPRPGDQPDVAVGFEVSLSVASRSAMARAACNARSASSPCDRGNPNTARTTSQTYLATDPSQDLITSVVSLKYRDRTSRSTSGSRRSPRAVELTRSEKSGNELALSGRRCPVGGWDVDGPQPQCDVDHDSGGVARDAVRLCQGITRDRGRQARGSLGVQAQRSDPACRPARPPGWCVGNDRRRTGAACTWLSRRPGERRLPRCGPSTPPASGAFWAARRPRRRRVAADGHGQDPRAGSIRQIKRCAPLRPGKGFL